MGQGKKADSAEERKTEKMEVVSERGLACGRGSHLFRKT